MNQNIGKYRKEGEKQIKSIHFNNLEQLLKNAVSVPLNNNKRFVIFSDLHIGDGGRNDNFRMNSTLFQTILRDYYYKQNYTLILNGDIEELQRFSFKSIKKRWKNLYRILDSFYEEGRFYKLYGNHDDKYLLDREEYDYPVNNSLVIRYKSTSILVIHGHQASFYYTRFNRFAGFWLRYFANLLRIKNFSSHSQSKFKNLIEKRISGFSKYKKIISIIGHKHRPFFESISHNDYADDIKEAFCNENSSDVIHSCLFNTGCGIGKHGITSIELDEKFICLVHWFDRNVSKKYLLQDEYPLHTLGNTGCCGVVLERDYLDTIIEMIELIT